MPHLFFYSTPTFSIEPEKELKIRVNKRDDLIAARKDMYDNTIHSSYDFDKLSDVVQYLSPLEVQTKDYKSIDARINKYERMLKSPYFARIDFTDIYGNGA